MAEENAPAEAAPAEAAPVSTPSPGGGGKLVLILTLVNVLVTAGIAGILAISFQKEKSKTTIADVEAGAHETAHEAAPAEGHGGGGGGHGGGGGGGGEHGGGGGHGGGAPAKKLTQYGRMLTLDQFTVNLASAGTVNPKFIRVNISLELPADEIEQELTQKMPRVRNVIIDLFNAKKASDVSTPEGRDFLKDEIRNALNSFLVSGKIKGVFFTNFALSG